MHSFDLLYCLNILVLEHEKVGQRVSNGVAAVFAHNKSIKDN